MNTVKSLNQLYMSPTMPKIDPKYLGGNLRDNGNFSYIEDGRFRIGRRHKPLTKNSRERFFNLRRKKFGLRCL